MVTQESANEYINIELSSHFFWEYCQYQDPEFFKARPFLKAPAQRLQWLYEEYMEGRARSITLSMPPRAGKSYLISLFCAWWLGKLPEMSVMRNSSTARLYEKLSYDTRKIVLSARYMAVFPHVELSNNKKSVYGWNLQTSKQVGYFGAAPGGTIIGFGANLAVYDDLYRGIEDALNDNTNEKILTWKSADHNSRKELDCPEIGIGTRWRLNDVIGREIEMGNVDKIFKVPALVRRNDELVSFCEGVNRTEFYLKEKRQLEPAIFNAEYMQEPVEMEGLLFPLNALNKYNPATVNVDELSIYRLGVIDPANEGGDDLAFPVGYLVQDKIYIHDVIYNRDGTDVNEDASYLFTIQHKINGVRFEGNSAWYLFGQAIRRKLQAAKSNCSFRIINNTEPKHTRILAQSAFIRQHFIFREDWDELPQYRRFMKNLSAYLMNGGAKHDDAPDALAELAKYFREQHKNLW